MTKRSLKQFWKELRREGLIVISYTGFLGWADFLKVDRVAGVSDDDQKRLRQYATLRAKASGHTAHRAYEKVQVIRELRRQADDEGKISAKVAVMVCELFNACDKSTLYRRAERSGFKLSTREKYPVAQIIKLAIGEKCGAK